MHPSQAPRYQPRFPYGSVCDRPGSLPVMLVVRAHPVNVDSVVVSLWGCSHPGRIAGRAQPLGGIRASATGSAIERGLVQPGFFRLRCRVFLGFAPSPKHLLFSEGETKRLRWRMPSRCERSTTRPGRDCCGEERVAGEVHAERSQASSPGVGMCVVHVATAQVHQLFNGDLSRAVEGRGGADRDKRFFKVETDRFAVLDVPLHVADRLDDVRRR